MKGTSPCIVNFTNGGPKTCSVTCRCFSLDTPAARSSCFQPRKGASYEYEDNKMVAAVADKLDSGEIQIYCVDSVDSESWYNKQAHPYWRRAAPPAI